MATQRFHEIIGNGKTFATHVQNQLKLLGMSFATIMGLLEAAFQDVGTVGVTNATRIFKY
jgi:hypothetical protein